MIGLAFHNVPETLALSLIVYSFTKNRGKAFIISIITIFVELLSFLIGYFFFSFKSSVIIALMTCLTAGIMTYISIDEMLPLASFKKHRTRTITGLVLGGLLIVLIKTFINN